MRAGIICLLCIFLLRGTAFAAFTPRNPIPMRARMGSISMRVQVASIPMNAQMDSIPMNVQMGSISMGSEKDSIPMGTQSASRVIQMVFTSDAHFGLTRKQFEGDSNVDAQIVNQRLIARINSLPDALLPKDGGIGAGSKIEHIDYLLQSGDIANRQEVPHQCATISWQQFCHTYLEGLRLKNQAGHPAVILLVPGNHDVSDAIGFYKPMEPATDPASLLGIYNKMIQPSTPRTAAGFRYADNKVNYSRNIAGIHFLFIHIWPDSANRIWMESDLRKIGPHTPVIIVCHDPPEGDAAHFTNPHGNHDINGRDKFENLLEETLKDPYPDAPSAALPGSVTPAATPLPVASGAPASAVTPALASSAGTPASTIAAPVSSSPEGKPQNDLIEQEGFVTFLKAHPNIKAYFHGHNNWNQFYTYTGPAHDITLPVFRVDSPMKGKYSAKDETRLSFQVITIDPATMQLTVRECLWNQDPAHPEKALCWGESTTIRL